MRGPRRIEVLPAFEARRSRVGDLRLTKKEIVMAALDPAIHVLALATSKT
jgi:hypothetical protein